ncbi:MAG: hypothetical protein CFE24_11795 [Flavobacterium sp. BFFFF2]|nr:MAG: hypothetical protein CFE24_11795 [Flavobacterium sp. BFFFF2]
MGLGSSFKFQVSSFASHRSSLRASGQVSGSTFKAVFQSFNHEIKSQIFQSLASLRSTHLSQWVSGQFLNHSINY